jgi:hypothetical protein
VDIGVLEEEYSSEWAYPSLENGKLCPPVCDKDIDQQLLVSDMEADDENAL